MTKFLGNNFLENIQSSTKFSGRKVTLDQASSWQEGLLRGVDSTSTEEVPVFIQSRSYFSILFLVSIFLILGIRLFHLQILQGHQNYSLSEENRLRVKRVVPERGLIYDANANVLAKNEPAFLLGLDLTALVSDQVPDVLQDLEKIVAFPLSEAQKKVDLGLEGGLQEVVLLRGLSRDTVLALETSPQELPGVYIDTSPIRKYTYPDVFSHALGYTGEVSPEELVELSLRAYQSGEVVGKTGLERFYEEYLHGREGRRLLERDATGRRLREISATPAESGEALYLTLDLPLQQTAYEALKEVVEKNKVLGGAVVVLRIDTGEVLSLVSYPAYDANIFSSLLSQQAYGKLLEDKRLPFLNRAISAQYPPASTFKLVTATAALEESVVLPETEIDEVQSLYVGGSTFSNWTLAWGVAPHGLLDIKGAIAQSSDIYFYEVGGGYDSQPGLGIDNIAKWAERFGYGLPAGIDLFGEVGGVVPTPQFKKQLKGEDWYLGDTYITAIGQGDMLATPLQVALMTSVVANGGSLYRPYLVSKIVGSKGEMIHEASPTVLRTVSDADTLAVVAEGMRGAVEYGTAVELRLHPGRIAAKTGTAETGNVENLHAWFTAFAPYEKPEIAVTVVVEGGGQGSQTSLPIAKKVFDTYFGTSKLP